MSKEVWVRAELVKNYKSGLVDVIVNHPFQGRPVGLEVLAKDVISLNEYAFLQGGHTSGCAVNGEPSGACTCGAMEREG